MDKITFTITIDDVLDVESSLTKLEAQEVLNRLLKYAEGNLSRESIRDFANVVLFERTEV